MGEIILLEKYQDMKQKKRESTEYIATLLSHMASEVSNILNKPGIEMMEGREIQERKMFEERYKDVISQAPDSAEAQLQYFASVLSNFLSAIFHGEQKDQFNTFMDFSEFYLSEFDTAYCEYRNDNKKYEKEYPFRFPSLEADSLENAMQNCLQQIINSNDKTEIMWQTSRLFELYHNMLDYFNS